MSIPKNPGAGDDRGGLAIDRLVSAAHRGLMPKLGAATATRAGLTIAGYGGGAAIGLDAATTTAAGALSATGYDKLTNWPQTRLNYSETADVLNATAITANTQTQVVANRTFAVQSTAARLLVEVRCAVSVTAVALANFGLRANFDNGGATSKLSGTIIAAGGWGALTGGVVQITGFAAGNHTIKLELIASQNATAYCRCSTAPNFEHAQIVIVELSP